MKDGRSLLQTKGSLSIRSVARQIYSRNPGENLRAGSKNPHRSTKEKKHQH